VDSSDPMAITAVNAIRAGDSVSLAALLAQHPSLATEQIHDARTPLLVATDWPGYFPNGPAIVRLLIAAGADPNADTGGERPETPLRWAASSDDADVADALITGGANLETPGGSIGTPWTTQSATAASLPRRPAPGSRTPAHQRRRSRRPPRLQRPGGGRSRRGARLPAREPCHLATQPCR